MKPLTDAELDAKLAETRDKFDDLIASADALYPTLPLEYLDVTASLSELGLDQPIDTADLDALLARPYSPGRTATTAPAPPMGASTVPTTGTVKISMRIPARVLIAFKARATELGKPYQALMIQALRDAALAWEAPAGKPAV